MMSSAPETTQMSVIALGHDGHLILWLILAQFTIHNSTIDKSTEVWYCMQLILDQNSQLIFGESLSMHQLENSS